MYNESTRSLQNFPSWTEATSMLQIAARKKGFLAQKFSPFPFFFQKATRTRSHPLKIDVKGKEK